MSKTLVTGGTGYLGRHLVDNLLAAGIPLRVLCYSDWKAEALAERGVQVVLGDVTQPETLATLAEDVDVVYHLVGGGSDGRRDPFELNTQGTRHVAEACQSAHLRAFVYVSSSSVYGQQPGPVDEESPTAPPTVYSRSKLEAETLLLDLARSGGFPAIIARMGGIYGPGAPILGQEQLQRGRLRITGDGSNVISVIHVEDAVRGLRAMAEYAGRGGTQRVFCLADDEPVPVLTFHSHLANLLGAPPVQLTSVRRVRLLIGVVRFLARVVGQKAPITEDLIRMATLDVHMQNRRMRRELGLEPRYPTYREGLAQVAAALGAEEEE